MNIEKVINFLKGQKKKKKKALKGKNDISF